MLLKIEGFNISYLELLGKKTRLPWHLPSSKAASEERKKEKERHKTL